MLSLNKYILVVCSLLLLAQCSSKGKEVEGSWHMQQWIANGVALPPTIVQGSTWVFSGSSYKVTIANLVDEGKYRTVVDTLFMKSETTPERAEMHYIIIQADSSVLSLSSDFNGNKTEINFIKANLP